MKLAKSGCQSVLKRVITIRAIFKKGKKMRQNNFKRTYVKPETQIILIKNETLLGQASFPSQHNPGNRRPGPSSAKAGLLWQEVGEEGIDNAENNMTWEE
jgi:hypothetical protein